MKRVKGLELKNNRKLFIIEPFEDSPLENHKGGEIAYDKKTNEFFVHECFLVMLGVDAIEKAINKIEF